MNTEINCKYNDLLVSIIENLKNEEVDRRLESFVHEMIEFCSSDSRIFTIYRILKEIEVDIALKKKSLDPSMAGILEKICSYINTEVEIALFKLNQPTLIDIENNMKADIPPLLKWTDDKVALVELIYAITKSVNNGKGSAKKIVACFEFIFQINLGNFYDTLSAINDRKTNITRYLDSLPKNLLDTLNKLNE
ncbi:RteC domain-containing protein [Dysgonomonas sp. ZJ709]|uniref:RteC domain-containing protein n=1 Tax=Dysgonomonas sp. ZJ709 TaxID=2709797 RepID=UPI0013ECC8AB|nr:RteC domain-containing protein [Dysgonomonas sp. ZJ709]